MDKLSLLKSVFIFKGLEENLLSNLTRQLKETTFSKNDSIFKEGKPADAFFIIDSGEITISKQIGPGKEKILAVLGPGNVFGEMAFFSDSPRTANAVSKTDAVLWKIERDDFTDFIFKEPKAGLRILSGLLEVSMDRLEQTSRELATIYQTGKVISSGKQLEEIIKAIQEEILLAIPEADNSSAFLYNEFNQEYDSIGIRDKTKEMSPDHIIVTNIKESPSGIIENKFKDSKLNTNDIFPNAKSILIAPILKSSSLLGFLALWSSKKINAFKNSHSLLVSSVAGQLAEAIENIRHYQEEADRKRLNNAKQNY